MAKKNSNKDGPYDVGYKKPPRHSQFQPGKSGNPNGRPKKNESVADVLQKELNSRVPILKDGKRTKISMLRAIFKQQLNKAASGDARAAAIFISALKLYKPDSGDNLGTLLQDFPRFTSGGSNLSKQRGAERMRQRKYMSRSENQNCHLTMHR